MRSTHDELIPTDPFWTRRRLIAVGIATLYVAGAFIADGFYGLCIVSGFLALPLACIWYPDVLGGITGWFGSTHIVRETPESVVSIVGWTFLFLPVAVAVLGYLVS